MVMKKLLSREPTPEMMAVFNRMVFEIKTSGFTVKQVLEAMWDAAPELPEPGEVERELRGLIDHLVELNPDGEKIKRAADLIAALSAKKELPEPGEVEKAVRDYAKWLNGEGYTAEELWEAADLIAALKKERDDVLDHDRKAEMEALADNERLRKEKTIADEDYRKLAALLVANEQGCKRLEAELDRVKADNERLRKDYEVALRVMAGVLSTKDGWTDKHPQEAYEYIRATIYAVKGEQK